MKGGNKSSKRDLLGLSIGDLSSDVNNVPQPIGASAQGAAEAQGAPGTNQII